jgi:hypothetical protein
LPRIFVAFRLSAGIALTGCVTSVAVSLAEQRLLAWQVSQR